MEHFHKSMVEHGRTHAACKACVKAPGARNYKNHPEVWLASDASARERACLGADAQFTFTKEDAAAVVARCNARCALTGTGTRWLAILPADPALALSAENAVCVCRTGGLARVMSGLLKGSRGRQEAAGGGMMVRVETS